VTVRYESDMIAPIKTCLTAIWEDSVVVEELGVGYGIADVVAAQTCSVGVRERLRLGQTATVARRGDVQVLHALRHVQEATFELLVELTGISAKRLKYDVLRFLLSENYVEEVRGGRFQLLGDHRPVVQEVWAVEAKTKNWFEGLCQAKRYQHFAHRTYLAIDGACRARVRDSVLREHNVGLIAVSEDEAEIVFHPVREEPRSEELFLMTNERIWQELQAL
jgi:hypothetical protein